MPRSKRTRRSRRSAPSPAERELRFEQFVAGMRRSEQKRDGEWNVQPVSATSALKSYTCPGCGGQIGAGTAHLVAWRADGLMGEAHDLAERRHWHRHCWSIEP